VRLVVDTQMVDDQDEVDEFEDYASLKDRVRRGPLLGILLGTTLVAGLVWVVLNAVVDIRLARGNAYIFDSETAGELWRWAQLATQIAYSVFLVALGSYVVLWLALREE
jgi:hypothetical protein